MKSRFFLINDIQSDQIEGLQQAMVDSDAVVFGELEALRRRTLKQGIQVQELTSIVNVLSRMLAEAGTIDPKVLAYRVEAELDERRAPSPEAKAPAICVICRATRAGSDVEMTPFGPVCEPSCPVPTRS